MNRQEIYNTVRDHLLAQNERAEDNDGCSYLTPEGLKCAVGCLIPDGHPGSKSIGSVYDLLCEYPDLARLWGVDPLGDESGTDTMFLSILQNIHDINHVSSWKSQLSAFAESNNLKA